MKKLLLLPVLFFLFGGFYSCNVPDITGDVCNITTEICSYASAICEIYGTKNICTDDEAVIKKDLQSASTSLQVLHTSLNKLSKSYSADTEQIFINELTRIRNEMKTLYLEKVKKVE